MFKYGEDPIQGVQGQGRQSNRHGRQKDEPIGNPSAGGGVPAGKALVAIIGYRNGTGSGGADGNGGLRHRLACCRLGKRVRSVNMPASGRAGRCGDLPIVATRRVDIKTMVLKLQNCTDGYGLDTHPYRRKQCCLQCAGVIETDRAVEAAHQSLCTLLIGLNRWPWIFLENWIKLCASNRLET